MMEDMTAHQHGNRSIVLRAWQAVLRRGTPRSHQSLGRRLDHEEVERRLAELYPR